MASLTVIATGSRKIVKYSIFMVIFLFIGRYALIYASSTYRSIFPKAPPPPTVSFGLMPKIPFPEVKDLPTFNFKVETSKGNALPAVQTQANVYVMKKITKNLFSLETTKKKAGSLGYSTNPEEITATVYKFRHPSAPAFLQIDIIYNNFSISYNLANDPQPLDKQPPTPEVASSQVQNFISQASLLPLDLKGQIKSDFLKVEGQSLNPALSLSDANLTRVSLVRSDLEKIPSVTQNPKISNVWFIVSGDPQRERQIISGEFHYFPIDDKQLSTYPIKTVQQALTDLQNGKGYIASLGENKDGQVTLRDAHIAYYDPGVETQFYQPVIVFTGDRNFLAYVPAITDTYYGK